MKLKPLFYAISTVLALSGKAQVIFSEDFNKPFSPSTQGWILYNNSDPQGGNGFYQGGVFTAFNGQPDDFVGVDKGAILISAGSGTISEWAITPTLNLENGTVLEFATITKSPITKADRLQIRMSTVTDTTMYTGSSEVGPFTKLLLDINPNLTANSNSVVIGNSVNGYPTSWAVYTIAVSGLNGLTKGRFAFRYYVTNGGPSGFNSNTIGLDAVRVIKSPCNAITQVTCGPAVTGLLPGGKGYPGYPSTFAQKVYSITPLISGQYQVSLSNLSNGSFNLYQSNSCGPMGWGASLGSVPSNSNSVYYTQLLAGSTYYFLIQDLDDTPNNFSIEFTCPVLTGPCASMSNIDCSASSGFTLEAGQGAWSSTNPGNEKIYSFKSTITGTYTINLVPFGAVTLYSSTACSENGWTTLNTASANSYTLNLLSGATQYFLIDDKDVSLTTGTCSIVCATPESCTSGNFGISKASSPIDEDIINVTIGSLNNTSSCTQTVAGQNSSLKQYSNFTGIADAPILQPGWEYQLAVTLGECGSGSCSDGGITVFIDYNADGYFDAITERVWAKEHCKVLPMNGNIYTTNITIPQGASSGYKRMRVIFNCDGLTGPTDSYYFGETEDYCVEIRSLITSINAQRPFLSHVSVYPNPTTGEFHVQLENSLGYKLVITNILGQVVLSQGADLSNTIDLSKMENGLYFLTVMGQNQVLYNTRIIKQ